MFCLQIFRSPKQGKQFCCVIEGASEQPVTIVSLLVETDFKIFNQRWELSPFRTRSSPFQGI